MDDDPAAARESLYLAATDFDADRAADALEGTIVGVRVPGDEEPWFVLCEVGDEDEGIECRCTAFRGRAGLDRLAEPGPDAPLARMLMLEIVPTDSLTPQESAKLAADAFDAADAETAPVFLAGDGSETTRALTNAEVPLFAVLLAVLDDAVVEGLLPAKDVPDGSARPVLVVHEDEEHLTHELTWERFPGDEARVAGQRARDAELAEVLEGRTEIRGGDLEAWRLAEVTADALLAARLESERQPDAESHKTYFGVRRDDVHEVVRAQAAQAFADWLALRAGRSMDRASPLDRVLRGEVLGPVRRVLEAVRGATVAIVRVVSETPFVVEDVETHARTEVTGTNGTTALEGDLVAARLVAAGDFVSLREAAPPLGADDVPGARELLARFGGEWTAASLAAKPHLLGRLWWWIYTPADDAEDDRGQG